MDQWMPITCARLDGTLCCLRFRDQSGFIDRPGPFFMNDDGRWYGADSLMRVRDKPTHYKPCERTGH